MTDHPKDPSRRAALECMLWAGSGLLWTVVGGVPRSALIDSAAAAEPGFSFAQISDSHIGFKSPINPDTPGTLKAGLDLVTAGKRPALMLHTGDVSHLSTPAQFDVAEKLIAATGIATAYVPGEHDVLGDGGTRPFIARFQKRMKQGNAGGAYYSFDQAGIHFVGLNNVSDLKAGGMGNLGAAQLAWLEADLRGLSASTPIVLFAHIPLWVIYPQWGWGTDDSAQAMVLLRRFGSVTVLNGHIHQVMQKVEGHVGFHTARSTAFPQPAPGSAPSPGPMKVEAGKLRSYLGVASIAYVQGKAALAIIDTPLGA